MWRDVFFALLYGILEGVTEWLPVSSTGHLILLDAVFSLSVRQAFLELFQVVIQLGAMLAVAVLFWQRLSPFRLDVRERRAALLLWSRVLLAVLPSVVIGLWLDDWLEAHLYTPVAVATALIVYGIVFLWIESIRKHDPLRGQTDDVDTRTAFLVGCFQVLSLVPGTSRSGATILGGMLLGFSRPAATEFSFFLGVPTMLGAGVLKCAKFFGAGLVLTSAETVILLVGTAAAFLTSLAVIRFLMDFVRRHSFLPFGVYRILLGGAVLAAGLAGLI